MAIGPAPLEAPGADTVDCLRRAVSNGLARRRMSSSKPKQPEDVRKIPQQKNEEIDIY